MVFRRILQWSQVRHQSTNTDANCLRRIIWSRSAVKSFTNELIPEEILTDILKSTQRAPSSLNIQPYSCIIVQDEEQKKRMSTAMLGYNAVRILEAPVVAVFLADLEPSKRVPGIQKMLRENGAPADGVAILPHTLRFFAAEGRLAQVCAATMAHFVTPLRPTPTTTSADAWSFKNVALAAQTYMLAAKSHGIDTCPMEGYDVSRLAQVLEIPNRYAIPLVIATGYAKPNDNGAKPSPRLPLDQVFFSNTFGKPFPSTTTS